MILAAVALIFALAGTAIAGPDALTRAITKSKVKTIAKKQANKVFNARADELKGESGPQGPQGPQGEQGEQGLPGAPGGTNVTRRIGTEVTIGSDLGGDARWTAIRGSAPSAVGASPGTATPATLT